MHDEVWFFRLIRVSFQLLNKKLTAGTFTLFKALSLIMFPLILYIRTVINILMHSPIFQHLLQNKIKKEQPPQAVLSCAILLLVIVILTTMTNAVES